MTAWQQSARAARLGSRGLGGPLLTVTKTGRWRPSDKRKETWHRDRRQREPGRPTF